MTSSVSLITPSIFVPAPLQSLLPRPNVSYIVLPKKPQCGTYLQSTQCMLERASLCCRVRRNLKNGLKLDCHHAQGFARDEYFIEVVALLFVN